MLDEMTMLAAAEAAGPPRVKLGSLCVCISPTRGIQLARVSHVEHDQLLRLVRVGGPAFLLEEGPDVLYDAKIFMVLDHVVELLANVGIPPGRH